MFLGKVKRKVNLLGDPGVGKTSLVIRYVKNQFGDEYLKTIGMNTYTKKVPLLGLQVKLLINDIMGEKNFNLVQKGAFKGSYGAIAVVDATRKDTLDSLVDEWIPRYRSLSRQNAPIILAINKDDLEDKELKTEDDLEGYYKHFDYYFFTSAKTGKQVNRAFKELASRTVYQTSQKMDEVEDPLSIDEINDHRELLDCVFLCTSIVGDMPYSTREELLKESGIDKFQLEEGVPKEEIEKFAEKVLAWYDEQGDRESSDKVRTLLEKYNH
ncbi:MAG: Rab family GTPase [Thermoplasmata archaeon]